MVKMIQGSYSGYTKHSWGQGIIHPIQGTPQHIGERGRGYPSYSGYTTTQLGEGKGLSILFRVHHNTVERGGGVIHPIQGTQKHSWERGRGDPSYSGYTTTQLGEGGGVIHPIQGTPQHSWDKGEELSILFRVHHNTFGREGWDH